MDAGNQHAAARARSVPEARRQPRYKLAVDVTINTKTCGILQGYTVDISEAGISAMLKLEVPLGELVELQFLLPFGPVKLYATVRQRNAFRYGFQFVESYAAREVIQSTCRSLAMEQTLFDAK